MMKKYIIISVWVLLSIGLILGVVFTNHIHNQRVCKSIEVKSDVSDDKSFLRKDEIINYLIGKTDSLIGKRVSEINENLLETVLNENPYVYHADVYIGMDGVVEINVVQRKAVVRIVNNSGQDFYLDDKGVKMPIKRDSPQNVVIANGDISSVYIPFSPGKSTLRDDTLNLAKDTILKSIFDIVRYINSNEFFKAQIEQIFVNQNKDIELFTKLGDQNIVFGKSDNIEDKFNKLLILYKEGFNKFGWNKYSTINLKYKNQVVCTKKEME